MKEINNRVLNPNASALPLKTAPHICRMRKILLFLLSYLGKHVKVRMSRI